MYLKLIITFGLITLINCKYLLVDVDDHKSAITPTNENDNILARCDFPPCYPPPRNYVNPKSRIFPLITCTYKCGGNWLPLDSNWLYKTRSINQKFDGAKGKKLLPMTQNDRRDSSRKAPTCITEQSSCSWQLNCCDGLFCNNGKCHKRNEFRNDDCSKMKCGETCIVEGDMVGMCNAKKECSFEYDNLRC